MAAVGDGYGDSDAGMGPPARPAGGGRGGGEGSEGWGDDVALHLLLVAASDVEGEERTAARERLLRAAETQEVRDLTFTATLYARLFGLVQAAWEHGDWAGVKISYRILQATSKVPEFDPKEAAVELPTTWVTSLFERMIAASRLIAGEELPFIKQIIHWLYHQFPAVRVQIRRQIGAFVGRFLRSQAGARGIAIILEILASIIRGFSEPFTRIHESVLHQVLIPLHGPVGMLTETQPVIAAYHEPLVVCTSLMLSRQPSLIKAAIRGIVEHWPELKDANSPKEVLLCHELETLLERAAPSDISEVATALSGLLVRIFTSEYVRLKQRGLQMFKNRKFVGVYMESLHETATPALWSTVLDSGEPHWNQSINKMRVAWLKLMLELGGTVVDKLCTQYAPLGIDGGARDATKLQEPIVKMIDNIFTPDTRVFETVDVMADTPTLQPKMRFHDLAFGKMLGTGSFSTVKYAKLIQRGVPTDKWPEYAVKILSTKLIKELGYEANIRREIAVLHSLGHPGIARLVASFRWRDGAYLVLEHCSGGDLHKQITTMGSMSEESTQFAIAELLPALKSVHENGFIYGDLKPENILLTEDGHIKLADFGAVRAVTAAAEAYLASKGDVIKDLRDGDWERPARVPRAEKQARPGTRGPAWAPRPTGRAPTGAPWAASPSAAQPRAVARPPTGAPWARGPAAAAPRAVVARPPTSAPWASGPGSRRNAAPPAATKPKKYAKNLPARPIARGVWPDPLNSFLKPEHSGSGISASGVGVVEKEEKMRADGTLIDEEGADEEKHAEVPTERSTGTIDAAADAEHGPGADTAQLGLGGSNSRSGSGDRIVEEGGDDDRLEGTAAYLSPELINGASPSIASDCWALGCVVYQCLAGRPPIWAESDAEVVKKIVTFAAEERSYPSGFPDKAKDLVNKLMEVDPRKRLGSSGLDEVMAHEFFAGIEFANIHKQRPPEMERGTEAPQADAAWARRQNSMMWSPMPQKYTLSTSTYTLETIEETAAEARTPFLPGMSHIPEAALPPLASMAMK